MAVAAIIALCSFSWSNKENGEIPADAEQMRTLYYRGHSYICYRFYKKHHGGYRESSYGYGYGGASIEHDPDCAKCKKNGK